MDLVRITSNKLAALLLALPAALVADTATGEGATDSDDQGYTLRWSDEFDQNGAPSRENWSFENGFIRNKEAQWYRADNAWCEDGLLVIEARRERTPIDSLEPGKRRTPSWARWRTHTEYTSASLNTREKHEWLYGRFLMRARIPAHAGAWPAFWTLGNGRWPACGEIDVMEYYDDSLLANVGWLGKGGKTEWRAKKTPVAEFGDEAWLQEFHDFRMDWDARSIALYVDDRLVNKLDLDTVKNADAEGANPFRRPHYVLVNLAIGGVHGGDPSATVFPLRYEIDFVRVYQRDEDQEARREPGAVSR